MDSQTQRIQYLTHKAQKGAITPAEKNELAGLLHRSPKEFEGSDGLGLLIALALAAIVAGIIAAILSRDD
jgi:hypothetical protein